MPLDESEYLRKKPQQSRSRAVVSAILEAADQLLTRVGDPEKVSLEGGARASALVRSTTASRIAKTCSARFSLA